MSETALFVLSGKILDRPFPLEALNDVRASVEKNLSDRGVVVTRRIATLCGDRHLAAPFFLGAGFEVAPSDDEDVQAAAIVCAAAFSLNPPDEIVFATGVEEPTNLARSIAGRTRRVLLRLPSPGDDFGLSESLARALEGVLDLRELLSKEGVNWNRLEARSWDSWSRRFDALLSRELENSPEEPEEPSEEPEATEPPIDVDPDSAEPPAKSGAEPAEPEPALESEAPAPVAPEDELIATVDVYSEFKASAREWNAALEREALEREFKCSAFKATEFLDARFPGLSNFFLYNRDDFKKLLSDRLRLIVEADGVTYLYHVNHPEMRLASASDLKWGAEPSLEGAAEPEAEAPPDDSNRSRTEEGFADLAVKADLMKRQSAWSARRAELIESGASYEDYIRPTDAELNREAKDASEYLWQRRTDIVVRREDFEETAELYETLEKALSIMDVAARTRELIGTPLVVRAMQLLASAQCAVKTRLRRLGVPLNLDRTQQETFERLADFRRAHYERDILRGMRIEDELDFSQLGALKEESAALEKEIGELVSASKDRKKLESKLNYHLGLVRKSLEKAELRDWNRIVEATTELCENYGEKPSSPFLGDLLRDVVARVPEELETSDAFCRVVQEIDWLKIQEEERECAEFEFARADDARVSEEVRAFRDRFEGSKIAFVGGSPKELVRERLDAELGVETIWFDPSRDDASERFEELLNDPEVKLALVYLPWTPRARATALLARAAEKGVETIALPRGTDPEQVARAGRARLDRPSEGRGDDSE